MTRRGIAAAWLALALSWAALPRPPLMHGIGFSQRVLDRDGGLLRLTLSPDEKYRVFKSLAEFSPELIAATLAKEDRWFYYHPGFNPVSLLRAAWITAANNGRIVGGSTITMQLARIRFGLRTRSPRGKLRQMFKALQLERHYAKDEILEAYLNLAPYGGSIEGAGAAALIYFGKDAKVISPGEVALLVELPQNPSRRGVLLSGREDIGGTTQMPFLAPHFTRRLLEEDYRRSGAIPSTLDLALQRTLESQIREYVASRRGEGIENAAAMLVAYEDMSVRAAVGSADFFSARIAGQVDGTRAPRSPGSTLKPFVYALGMDQGLLHAQSLLEDAPTRFGAFTPENFDGRFEGPVSVRRALISSRNVPAVQVSARLKAPDFYDFLRAAGVDLPESRDYYGLAPVLGGVEVTMERLAALYGMLASGGVLRPLRARLDEKPRAGKRLLSAESSYIVLDILKDNPRPGQGFRGEWITDGAEVFWKSGTSYGFRDAWSAGIVGQYVLLVWLGNFDGSGNPALVGASAAAPLFFRIADALRPRLTADRLLDHARLGSLSEARVCAVSGKRPTGACGHTLRAWVIPGVSPIDACAVHKALLVDARTGIRACAPSPSTRREVYEFWPSDLLELFKRAGLGRRVPPEPNPSCAAAAFVEAGAPPRITAPDGVSAYALRMGEDSGRELALSAVSDADTRLLYWFADGAFIGQVESGRPLFWKPRVGRSVLRVVDEHGRSDSRTVETIGVRPL